MAHELEEQVLPHAISGDEDADGMHYQYEIH